MNTQFLLNQWLRMGLFVLLVLTGGCAANIYLPQEFKAEATPYSVKGRQGWMMNQHLTFGEFSTSKINRGWTKSYNIPFIVTFQGAKEKLQFTQYDGQNKYAHVMAVSKLRSQEINWLNEFFGITLKYENTFTGTVVNHADSTGWWNFVLFNPDENWGKTRQTSGFAINKANERIEIRPINQLETKKGPGIRTPENYGFEFWYNNQPVAAVSVLNDGVVWLSNSLTENDRLTFAALASAIMLRNNITEVVESEY